MGEAANDLLEGDEPEKKKKEPPKELGLSFNRKGAEYQIDKSSSIRASVALGLDNGRPKVKSAGVEYRKEF